MVRLRVAQMMKSRGITAYALAKGAGLNYPTAWRLSRPGGEFKRLEAATLNRLCEFFGVQPGELIEWVQTAPRTRR
ncbi:MAG: helix-turn-helix domain-containing protein [Gemmatimonadaceae bacterium]